MADVHPSVCRLCGCLCPVLVTVEDGRATKVTGDPDAPLYQGFTCPKGRALPEQHHGPTRLLHPMKRGADGVHRQIGSEQAMDEIAEKLSSIIARHGPRSVGLYWGTGMITFPLNIAVTSAFMQAIGSPMNFNSSAIDKPGAPIAQSAHGHWMAGHPPFEAAEAWIIIGLNPIVSGSGGFPPNNPGRRLKEAVADRGMKLIVIDPRVTQSSQRAHIHLRAKPGEDPAILAAMMHVIIEEKLYDADFIAENVQGFEQLREAVAPFTPAYVADRAHLSADDIVAAARVFARSRYAGIGCGTGPSFSLTGALTDYLAVTMMTLCGFWSREGDPVTKPNILLPAYEARAEALPPFQGWGFGPQLRMRGLGYSVAGMPTGAIADEILMEGEGQIKALLCMAGNPMMAWPDQHRASAALKALELLVTAELEMSATARMSDYVIAPKLTLEMPMTSTLLEAMKYYGHLRGVEGPYARYTPAVIDPPAGSDVIGDWELYYGLAQRMGLQLNLTTAFGMGQHLEAETLVDPLDMVNKPTDDDLLALTSRTSRIPLDVVKQYPHGHLFEEIRETVKPKRPGSTARLDIGNAYMMEELARVGLDAPKVAPTPAYPFILLPRRTQRIMNSCGRMNARQGGIEPYNPAYLHPDDLARLGVRAGDRVEIASPYGRIVTIAAADTGLPPGYLSITHGFGNNPDEEEIPEQVGGNVGRLLSADAEYDAISGIPRMGALPVAIRAVAAMVA